MSDNFLRLVTTDPEALPQPGRIEKARDVVAKRLPGAEAVEVHRFDSVHFIDCGGNFESVLCPSCGADLLSDGVWTRLMDQAWESGMSQRRFALACCSTSYALEELDYRWPVAFGRFSIDARNPDVDWFHPDREDGNEAREFLAELSLTVGAEMKAIWQHL